MKSRLAALTSLTLGVLALGVVSSQAQVMFQGRAWGPRLPELEKNLPANTGLVEKYFDADGHANPTGDMICFGNLRVFFTRDGALQETMASGTWQTEPAGWYMASGPEGRYTMVVTGPAHFLRPMVFTNIFTKDGDGIDRKLIPHQEYAIFWDGSYDEKAASQYFQTFVAKGTGVTTVGFKPVHDGIDGIGPGSQNISVSIHHKGKGTPDTWEQVGPAIMVQQVDAGGPKDYVSIAGWNSGEVPLKPGDTYAVRLKPELPDGKFQMFWHPDENKDSDCYRLGNEGETGFVGRDLWMTIGTDGDGLLIPYNKRIHKEYVEFAGSASKWSQTYVAQGRSLAAVTVYSAMSGVQPGISRQRVAVRVREGGPDGKVVGVEKIAIGQGNFTGDASWGAYVVAFSPGEVPLEPGKTYAIEIETIENFESLNGYVNIKGMASDNKPGFNPYRKHPLDNYEQGDSFFNGAEKQDFDLDMQIIEYQNEAKDWAQAVDSNNLLPNGNMEAGKVDDASYALSKADSWKTFAIDPGTVHWHMTDSMNSVNAVLRVTGGPFNGKTADGGYVQRVEGLSRLDTYRLNGKVRSSHPVDFEHVCYVGFDPTGQDSDPLADTIQWTKFPSLHSHFVDYASEPIRPAADSISVWLRGATRTTHGHPFKADFDEFSLNRVKTEAP